MNFEVRLEEFIFKSASRLSMTILDPPIATLVANFQSRVLNPDAFITTRGNRLYWEAPSDRSSPISRPTGAADLIDTKISLSRSSQSFHRSWSKFVQAAVQISVRMEFLVGTAEREHTEHCRSDSLRLHEPRWLDQLQSCEISSVSR